MRKQAGFTLLELVIAIIATAIIGAVVWSQTNAINTTHRDSTRKTAINAMYYNLEEVVYPTLGGYPRVLQASQLRAMDSSLMVDPNGKPVGDPTSDYRYEPSGCSGGDICQHYTLRTSLEREADFVRQSRH